MLVQNHGADFLERAIAAGCKQANADIVLKNAKLFSVLDGSVTKTDIAIVGDRIVGTHAEYSGKVEIDAQGRFAVPGFIDTHLHIESSLVTPFEFERCVLPHGVTTAICDPHEIANVLGSEGIRYFLSCAERTLMDVRINLSSCVPATQFETSGACLEIADLLPFRDHPQVIGLAEFMNFPGVIHRDPKVLAKLAAFQDRHIDGHAPLLSGTALNAYLSAGIRTDHEATSAEEALEKLSKGMTILIREGSVSKDLDALAPILQPDVSGFVALCTDDRNPLDIAEEGHLDSMIRRLIAGGTRPLDAYRAASWSAARAFGLMDRGQIAPGWRADIVLLDNLEECRVSSVISGGVLASQTAFDMRKPVAPVGLDSVNAHRVTAENFKVSARNQESRVIGVVPGRIITEDLSKAVPVENGEAQIDTGQDVLKVAVVERHKMTGNIGVAFVSGFGMTAGAIASSVAHDSHNICVVGADEAAMAHAVNRVIDLKGGFVVADADGPKAELALPLAGLMSLEPFESVHDALQTLRSAATELGCTLPEPFLQVAFLPLPVIPHLKITDLGLFDVNKFELVDPAA
ncbi:adenine deaminase [Roseibium hamelinense]|uniref:Adenine deaminase n=1 Tax=Roseibium hamelinense TaxID=150831 RepID=A0A562T9I7_9HYPH|nr:adenine deaminase [Roseibium hamelinense]MTI45322.1 adenine deaminase [Roseibium hamelinense]TWI90311.1 adenine deaminase [Roseibium hamelinense]